MRFQAVILAGLSGLAVAGCSKSSTSPPPNPGVPAASAPAEAPLSPATQQRAMDRGAAIAQETFGLLSSNLLAAIQSGGVSNAIPFCSLAASPLTASMATRHGVGLRRITHKPRNPTALALGAEMAILQGFEATLTATGSTNPPPPRVTQLVPGKVTFLAPILLNRDLCLKCHGEPGRDITDADLAVIRRQYPADQATGFRLGQLRGAWRIDFPAPALEAAP